MDRIAAASALERSTLFRRVESGSTAGRWHAAIAEKDFWVCWSLYRIFQILQFRPHLIFKGGTSLSKVHHLIERFSEDVDLSLSRRDLGFADDRDPEQPGISKKEARRRLDALVAECKRVIREKLVPALRQDFAGVLGNSDWSVELDLDDPQTVLFAYPPTEVSGGLSYVRPAIRLEMGARSDDWPAADAEITPYAAEVFPALFSVRTCKVRTLWQSGRSGRKPPCCTPNATARQTNPRESGCRATTTTFTAYPCNRFRSGRFNNATCWSAWSHTRASSSPKRGLTTTPPAPAPFNCCPPLTTWTPCAATIRPWKP